MIYRQHVRAYGGDVRDSRNVIRLTFECHGGHHSGAARVHVSRLPDAVFEYAAELMGPGAAGAYLARYYAGRDARLAVLLA